VIFLPWTTLVYTLAYGYNAIVGEDWLWLAGAFAVDMATYFGGAYYRAKGENAINPLKWLERSTALRTLMYILVGIIGFLAGLYFVIAPLISDGAAMPGFYAEYFPVLFVIYLVLGFIFCFVDPTQPWLAALLLAAPALLLLWYFSSGSSNFGFFAAFVVVSGGAATAGAYLGALLLKRGKAKEPPVLLKEP
jgi:hypothetical protein